MPQVCILTDSTAQFTSPNFSGHELVTVLPMRIQLAQNIHNDGAGFTVNQLPISAKGGLNPKVLPPAQENIRSTLKSLGKASSDILVILLSSRLNPAIETALETIDSMHISASVHIIDSHSLAAGQGLVVQAAAQAAKDGMEIAEIKRLLNGFIPRLYSIYYIPNLTYLYHAGQLDPGQAIVGEMMGIMPLFILENGRLVPSQKARNPRNLVEILFEFLVEFTDLEHICLVHGVQGYSYELRTLHERIQESFPNTPLSEHKMGAAVGALLGPRSLGVTALVK